MKKIAYLHAVLLFSLACAAHADVAQEQLRYYQQQGATRIDVQQAAQDWKKVYRVVDGKQRSCESCHGQNLQGSGKHIKTGKRIDPIARSANTERFTDAKKIEKWFKRNCKWTLGRECSVQEKANFLSFLLQQ